MSQNSTLKIDREYFTTLKSKLDWNGDGTQSNPIVINNLSDLSQDINIVKIWVYITIKDLTINSLNFHNCRNITIQNCKIQSLILSSCYSMVVNENSILNFSISFGGNHLISRNKIFRNALSNAKERVIEKAMGGVMGFILFLLISFVIVPLFVLNPIPIGIAITLQFLTISISAPLGFMFLIFKMYKIPRNEFEGNVGIDGRDF